MPVKVNLSYPDDLEAQNAARRYGIRNIPAIVFLSKDGGFIAESIGFLPPERFAPVMENALQAEAAFQKELAKLKEMPDDAKLNGEIALAYLARMQLEKAIPFSKKTFKGDADNTTGLLPKLHTALGTAYGMTPADDENAAAYRDKAVTHFRTVIDVYPESDVYEPAQFYLGVVYAIQEKYDKSIEVLEKLVQHATDDNIRMAAESELEQVRHLSQHRH